MFEMYATGNYSTKTIVNVLYDAGLKSSSGGKVYKSRVAELLTDPFYIGKIRYNGAIHAGAHEPLINEDLFNAVQVKIKRNGAPRYRKHTPLFKALIKCSECGGSVTWEIQKGHWYGHCNKYRNCTQRKFIRQEKVEENLMPYFEKINLKNERLIEWIKKALNDSHADEISYSSGVRSNLNSRYQIVQKRLEAIYDDKIDGKITPEFYQTKYDQYTKEKEEVLSELKKLDNAGNKYYELGASIIDLAHRAKEIYSNPKRTIDEKRLLMNLMFSTLTIKDGELTVGYSKAFEILAKFTPAWKKFEPKQNTAIFSGALLMEPFNHALELSEPRNNIRTSEKPPVKARFGDFYPKSRPLLREQGSNLRPSR
ncbi:MAG: recombinase family protein [Candidatus Harrisonbacteria bacterium]|nr:recombinase family protein [Candidatus Harrisonbacteria bacterium]